MKKLINDLNVDNLSFLSKKVILCPSSKMKNGIEKKILEEINHFVNVQVLTIQKWVAEKTREIQITKECRLIDHFEQNKILLSLISDEDEILKNYQKDLDLAEILSDTINSFRCGLLPDSQHVFVKKYENFLNKLMKNYTSYLANENLWDEVSCLSFLSNELKNENEIIYYIENKSDSPLINKVLDFHEARRYQLENSMSNKNNINSTFFYSNNLSFKYAFEKVKNNEILSDDTVFIYTNSALLNQMYDMTKYYNVPSTFSSGISIENSNIYKIFEDLLEYIVSNKNVNHLKDHLTSYRFSITDNNEENNLMRKINILLRMDGVFWGERIPFFIEDIKLQEDLLEKDQLEWTILSHFFTELHKKINSISDKNKNQLEQIVELLKFTIVRKSEKEHVAFNTIIEYLLDLSSSHTFEENLVILKRKLLSEVSKINIQAGNEEEGKLFITHISDFLITSRKNVFIFGLDSNSFPTQKKANPFLKREAFKKIGRLTEKENFQYEMNHFYQILSNHDQQIELCTNLFDSEKIRPLFIDRKLKSLVPFAEQMSFTIKDLDKRKLVIKENQKKLLDSTWLKDNTFSPSSLVTLADCNRKFFLNRILKHYPTEKIQTQYNKWLPANKLGDLYHQLLEKIVNEYLNSAENQSQDISSDMLKSIAKISSDEIISHYQNKYIPLKDVHVIAIRERLEQVLDDFIINFLSDIEDGWIPVETEFTFDETLIELKGNESNKVDVKIKGIIDRIDWNPKNKVYRVIDYKTGSKNYVNSIQLVAYTQAYKTYIDGANKRTLGEVDLLESKFHMLMDAELINRKNMDKEIDTLIQKILDFDKNWMEGNKSKCSFCEYKYLCQGLEVVEGDSRN